MSPIRNPKRNAVTLVEVLFAIGVVLIGLVGLASVLPVAARRAQDSIDLNEASALASAVFDELEAKGALRRSAWVVRLDQDRGSFGPGTTPPVDAAFPNATSWCIDPMFVSADVSALTEANGGYFNAYNPNSGNGYRRMLFPHYRGEHDPLADPSLPPDEFWRPVGSIAPRMLRVGVGRQQDQGGLLRTPDGEAFLFRSREAEALVETLDEVSTFKPEDRTLNVVTQDTEAVSGGSPLGKRVTDGSLTWIATCNQVPGSTYMSVSVVVMRKRDRSFFTYPVTDTQESGPAKTSDGNSTAERLAYVNYANGFTGGAGGTVQIMGPAEHVDANGNPVGGLSPRVVVNDWVMLSRQLPSGGDVHRWFRVASVDEEPEFLTVDDPVHGDPHEVWQRTVYLDGPDWSFGFPTPGFADKDTAGGTVLDNTYVTIMDDVIAVSEHMIRMQ